jgi:hypothetical protein
VRLPVVVSWEMIGNDSHLLSITRGPLGPSRMGFSVPEPWSRRRNGATLPWQNRSGPCLPTSLSLPFSSERHAWEENRGLTQVVIGPSMTALF